MNNVSNDFRVVQMKVGALLFVQKVNNSFSSYFCLTPAPFPSTMEVYKHTLTFGAYYTYLLTSGVSIVKERTYISL